MEDLIMAALGGEDDRVGQLIAAGANVNHADGNGWTALVAAAMRGNEATVERLLAAGANVECADIKGMTALMPAAAGGHIRSARCGREEERARLSCSPRRTGGRSRSRASSVRRPSRSRQSPAGSTAIRRSLRRRSRSKRSARSRTRSRRSGSSFCTMTSARSSQMRDEGRIYSCSAKS